MTTADPGTSLFAAGGGGGKGGFGGGRNPKFVEIKLDKLFDRPVPHAPEAEMALLGAMILDPRVTGDVMLVVKSPTDFYLTAHGAIYRILVTLYDKHQAGDLVQLLDALRHSGELDDVGGVTYLEKLASETPGSAGALHWARIVADKAKLRSLIETAGSIIYDAFTQGGGTETTGSAGVTSDIVDRAEQKIFEIARKQELFEPQALAELVQAEYDRIEAQRGQGVSGLKTEYIDLDRMLGGLQGGEMIIIAARPSMGKTALALNLAEQVAVGLPNMNLGTREKVPIGFFSLEMSKAAIAQRLLSARSGIPVHDLRTGGVSQHLLPRLDDACGELHEAPIYVDDMPALTVMALRARARRMVQQYGVRAIFIDYLQLMTAPAYARESRQVEVSAISRGIKALARELSMPIVCLAQLNRGPESRSDNRPRMSDLRESGAIEQDADVIILLHREEYYHIGDPDWINDPANDEKKGIAELIVAKQRNGPTGVVELVWDAETTRFKNMARSRGGYASEPISPTPMPARRDAFGGGPGTGGGQFVQQQRPHSPTPRPSMLPPQASPGPAFSSGGSGASSGAGAFSAGRATGPIESHRDGGGPDREPLDLEPINDVPEERDDTEEAPF